MSVTSRVRSKAAERLLNRELSWLEFNARVLALAAHFLSGLFPQMEIAEAAAFRVTRDADFSVSDEGSPIVEKVRSRADNTPNSCGECAVKKWYFEKPR
jgi:polyphosphate kinase